MTLRRFSSLLTALAALAILAGPTWSSRVVAVRVGTHPTFTRVVFELDAPAGYRIERREVDGGQELVVELSAASAPRQLKSRSEMVAGVDLEQSGNESVARIRLRGASPRVKEMILGGPPRIVLDVMRPDQVATPAVAPKPDAEAPRVAAKDGAPEAVKPDAKPAVEAPKAANAVAPPKAAERREPPKVAEKAALPKVAEKPAPPKVAEKPEPTKLADAPKPPAETPKLPKPPATKPAEAPIAQVENALEGERIVQPKVERPDRAEDEAAAPSPAPAPAPVAEAPPPVTKPPAAAPPKPVAKAPSAPSTARPAAEGKGPFGLPFGGSDSWLPLGLVGAGLLLFLGVVAMLLRRHSKPTSLDALEVARETGEPIESDGAFGTSREPFRSAAPVSTFPVAGPGLFDDERDKGESEMDVAAELPIERGARSGMTPIGAGSDLGSLVEQLERRMAQLESRLDEANEARERLERQVTAQSEELRVQRAAIARTQRALRGMTRGGEDQATEPALRDPSKPSTGRA